MSKNITPKPSQSILEVFKEAISGWWNMFHDLILEPILFGFGLLLLYSRLQPILETANNIRDFQSALGEDMINNPLLYVIFLIIFIIWVVFKLVRIMNETKRQRISTKSITDILERIETKLDKLGGDDNGKPTDNSQPTL